MSIWIQSGDELEFYRGTLAQTLYSAPNIFGAWHWWFPDITHYHTETEDTHSWLILLNFFLKNCGNYGHFTQLHLFSQIWHNCINLVKCGMMFHSKHHQITITIHYLYFSFNFQSWDVFFRNSTAGAPPGQAYVSPYSLSQTGAPAVAPPTAGTGLDLKVIDDHLAVQAIIRSYQVKAFIVLFFLNLIYSYNIYHLDSIRKMIISTIL